MSGEINIDFVTVRMLKVIIRLNRLTLLDVEMLLGLSGHVLPAADHVLLLVSHF